MSDPELTPAQEERVRRLLSEARHRDPMPADVVARLDAVLAELSSEPAQEAPPVVGSPPPGVVTLASRRRRRFGAVLVAAAAVTVLGVGLSELDGPASMNASDSGGEAGDSAGLSQDETAPEASGADEGGADAEEQVASPSASEPARDTANPSESARRLAAEAQEVSADGFRRDVRRLATLPPVAAAKAGSLLQDCEGAGTWGPGDVLPASYDGRLGALVYRAPSSDGQQVDLFLCGVDGPVRGVILPAPDAAP